MRYCLALLLVFVGCGVSRPYGSRTQTSQNYNIVVIDGCQYIEFDYGIADHRVYSLCHKGNCTNPIHQYNTEVK